MKLRDRLRCWLGIDDDISRTMLMMTRMDSRLTTRVDCMGLTAELIDPTLKVRLDELTKRVAALEQPSAASEQEVPQPRVNGAIAVERYRRECWHERARRHPRAADQEPAGG